jgi:predicted Fe-Mo cluster-binding NifX family protein
MKIAIPTFGSRVSPRFDCAQDFLIVTAEDGIPQERRELAASGWAPHERINKLVDLGVDTVLCGGIDCWSAESLQSAGVNIYSLMAGEIDDCLAALVRGDLDAEAATQAGGRSGCRRLAGSPGIEDPNLECAPGLTHQRGRGGRRGQRHGEGGLGRPHGPPP